MKPTRSNAQRRCKYQHIREQQWRRGRIEGYHRGDGIDDRVNLTARFGSRIPKNLA
jgi:hypothetical protein